MGKLRKQRSRFKTVKELARPKVRKRVRRIKKLRELKKQLKNLTQKLIKKGVIDQTLLNFIRDIQEKEEKINFCKTLIEKSDLAPSDYYEISEAIDDESLKKEVQQKYLKIASADEIVDIIEYEYEGFQKMAWQELCQRIQRRHIKKRRVRRILIKIFKEVAKYRVKAIDILQYLEPSDKDLKSLLDLRFMDKPEFGELRIRIEKLIRKGFRKKNSNTNLISKIQKTKNEIEKLKKGQL